MTRQDILKEYQVDVDGRIVTPGKFNGEMVYLPYYHDQWMQGCVDGVDDNDLYFAITDEEHSMFPELQGRSELQLEVDALGNTREVPL